MDGGRVLPALLAMRMGNARATGVAASKRGSQTPVLEVMQTDVPTVSAHAKLDTALRSLIQRSRPVVVSPIWTAS
jgi:hypothetical protein